MTGPRFRRHADGRWAFHAGVYQFWTVVAADGAYNGDMPETAMAQQQGWVEAALVALPEPVVTARVCGCGQAPEGAPGWEGCSAHCMAPEVVTFDHLIDLDLQDGVAHDGVWRSYTREAAEHLGAALIAAARWGTTGGDT
jgi:hypothetical protein